MRHSETSLRLDSLPAGRGGAAAVRAVTAPLPSGWICLRDSNISGLLSRPVQIHYVLLHPDVGIALLDVAPTVTPDAEAILRQRLAAVRFDAIFQGYLPIVYRSIRPDEVNAIDDILAEAFAALPPLTLAGGDAWVTVMQRALSPRDPSRAATPSAPPGPRPGWRPQPSAEPPAAAPPKPRPVPRAAPEAYATPPRATEPEEGPPPPDDAEPEPLEPISLAPVTRRLRPAGWMAAGLGAVLAISGLAAVMSGGDRAAPAGEGMPRAPDLTATAPLPEPSPVRPGTAPADMAGPAPATPRSAEVAPGSGPALRSEAAPPAMPAPAEAPSSGAVAALPATPPPPPAPPAPERGGAAGAGAPPPPPARPAVSAQAAAGRVEVRSPANLRTGPGNSYAVLRVTRRGETFRVYGHALGGWVEVGDDKPQGWIHSSLLKELAP